MIPMSDLQRVLNAQDVLTSVETLEKIQPSPNGPQKIAAAKDLLQRCIAIFNMEYPLDMNK